MNSAKILKIVSSYTAKLATISEEDFMRSPPMGGWSYSEVYSHIFDSSLLSLMAMQHCIKGEGKIVATPFGTKVVLFFGMLPPGKKYVVPSRLAARVKKITRQEAQQFITDFETQLVINLSGIEQADSQIKTQHPRLGYLNAKQWLRFIEIHFRHHLKQLSRIEKNMLV